MRKAFIVLTGILFTLLFATCKQFTADIDDYLSRWSSEAFIQSSTIDKKTYNDGSSIPSVASADKVTITLKVQNPKSFKFVMPSASETRNIVGFAHQYDSKDADGCPFSIGNHAAYADQFAKWYDVPHREHAFCFAVGFGFDAPSLFHFRHAQATHYGRRFPSYCARSCHTFSHDGSLLDDGSVEV